MLFRSLSLCLSHTHIQGPHTHACSQHACVHTHMHLQWKHTFSLAMPLAHARYRGNTHSHTVVSRTRTRTGGALKDTAEGEIHTHAHSCRGNTRGTHTLGTHLGREVSIYPCLRQSMSLSVPITGHCCHGNGSPSY